MRQYATSKFRILLLATLAIALLFIVKDGFAQTATTAPAAAAAGAGSSSAAPAAAPGIFNLIAQNIDFIFGTIAVLSIWGVTLIIQGFIKNRRSVYLPDAVVASMHEMIANRRLPELLEYTENNPSFVARALNPALKRAPNFEAMREAMETAVAEETAEEFRRIEYLNIIGNLGPLLGLLGTVWGMIVAFQRMQAAGGSATPADLAGGIGIALTHTFLGLVLAVPCLAAFGILRTLVDRFSTEAALKAEDLLLMLRAEAGVPARAAVAAPAPVARAQPTTHP